MAERTLPQLFEDSVKSYPGNVLIWEKAGSRYEPTTYAAMRDLVHRFAAGLMSLGLGKGDRAALLSEGRRDWIMSELAILFAGAVNVPISVKVDELSDLKFRLAHSGCRLVVVSRSQVAKIRQVRNDLPELTKTIVLDDLDAHADDEMPAAGSPNSIGRGSTISSRPRSRTSSIPRTGRSSAASATRPEKLTTRRYLRYVESSKKEVR